jgi:hypothetical protein
LPGLASAEDPKVPDASTNATASMVARANRMAYEYRPRVVVLLI